MREPIFDSPYLQAACLLCFVIGIGFWYGVLMPLHPIAFSALAAAFGFTACSFCLGLPLPPIWVPFFWILGFLFGLMRLTGNLAIKVSMMVRSGGSLIRGRKADLSIWEHDIREWKKGIQKSGKRSSGLIRRGKDE